MNDAETEEEYIRKGWLKWIYNPYTDVEVLSWTPDGLVGHFGMSREEAEQGRR
jgi:hypothetical protein